MGFLVGWRRRRSRISATTGDMAAQDTTLQEVSGQVARQPLLMASKDTTLQEDSAQFHMQRVMIDPSSHEAAVDNPRIQPKELPTEVDGLIIEKLQSLSDRCALESVCHRWRSSTQQCASPPLPLIVNADFTITDCFAKGPRSDPLPLNSRVPHPPGHDVTSLGSLGNWVVFAFDEWSPQGNLALPHKLCYLVQPVKGIKFTLPSPCSAQRDATSGSINITGGNGQFTFYQPTKESSLRMKKVVLSQSSCPADSNAVGLATQRGAQHLVFSAHGMQSWFVCSADFITAGSDIEFLEDKVIVLGSNQEAVFQIDFGPKMSYFPIICEVKMCMAIELPEIENTNRQLNLVRSGGGGLLLVARYFTLNWEQLNAVRVYSLHTPTWSWQQIESLGELCILVSLSSSQAITASGQSDPKADHIYFLDQFCPNFFPGEDDVFSYRSQVYSMRDGNVTELLIGRGGGTHRPGFPMWYIPAE